jgi:Fe-S-cluster-containing hydrogenase component 2
LRRIFVNSKKCTGCRICELACSLVKNKTCSPAKSMIRIVTWPKEGLSVPVVCRQCGDAPCARACPVEAIRRDEKTGAWFVDLDTCCGSGVCVEACPFGAMTFDNERGKSVNCDLCEGKPKCVEVCPTNAIEYIGASEFSHKRGESLEKLKKDRFSGGET